MGNKPRGGARRGAGRPLLYGEETKQLTITLPQFLRDELEKAAWATNKSRSRIIADAMTAQLHGSGLGRPR